MPLGSPLQRELKQGRPFSSPSQEAMIGLLRTADVLRRVLAQVVEPHGITLQQYNVLRILRGAGPDGLPTLEIVERMIEQAPGITRLLDRLEAKSLVARVRCPRDRRQVLCSITGKGQVMLASLDEPVAQTDSAAVSMLSTGEQKRLIKSLDAIRTAHTASA